MLFAAQQISEGFLWLSLENKISSDFRPVFTHTFLFFAQVLWPFWVTFSVLKWRAENTSGGLFLVLTLLGSVVSAYLAFCLLVFPVSSQIEGSHIRYIQDYPQTLGYFSGVFYVMATVVPLLLYRSVLMKILGVLVFISYLMTAIFYAEFVVSVWCYFAALLSAIIYIIVRYSGATRAVRT